MRCRLDKLTGRCKSRSTHHQVVEVVAGVRVTAQFTLRSPHVASWPCPGAMATKHSTMVQQGEEHRPSLPVPQPAALHT